MQDLVCAEAFHYAIYPSVTELPALYVMYYCDVFAYLCDEGVHLVRVVQLFSVCLGCGISHLNWGNTCMPGCSEEDGVSVVHFL